MRLHTEVATRPGSHRLGGSRIDGHQYAAGGSSHGGGHPASDPALHFRDFSPPRECHLVMRILLSTDDGTPQNEIRYQVFSNGVPVPGRCCWPARA